MIQFNTILDYFVEEPLSKIWPSDDPNDSPYNRFRCKECNWSFDALIYGAFPIGVDPYDAVRKRIVEHLTVRHSIRIPIY